MLWYNHPLGSRVKCGRDWVQCDHTSVEDVLGSRYIKSLTLSEMIDKVHMTFKRSSVKIDHVNIISQFDGILDLPICQI